MEKIALSVEEIANQGNYENAYTLILAERGGNRKLPVVIGISEAQAIAIELDGITPQRPLVYDFVFRFAQSFNIEVVESIITNVEKGIFYAEIVCRIPGASDDDIVRLDARTSDAVAIALKFRCPIYTYEVVLSKAGYVFDNPNYSVSKPNLEIMTDRELHEILQKAIEKEDYEFASVIRDEIQNRKK
ncbi:MAG: bifunctional nuclease family protein [Bacteroidales bacterium]|jgi:hypothetical protein|nr:bifunctional nuclease family protein [Bacteroidales bacterium]